MEGKLNTVIIKLVEAEARMDLFSELKKRGMCTRDIFQAAMNQLRSRRVLTKLDRQAINKDMTTKIRDAQVHIKRLKEEKIRLRQLMLSELGGKRFLLRRLTKRLNTEARTYKNSLKAAYIKKIKHYEKEQAELLKRPDDCDSTINMSYNSMEGTCVEKYINVIREVDLLQPEPPGMPMICDKNIKLSHSELSLLARGPRFSVRSELNEEEFEVELESMITKKKYRSDTEEDDASMVEVERKSTGNSEKEEAERRDNIAWEENRTTAVFDWQEKTVSLARMRANKYKYNKHVCMPKVSDPQSEARHDIRKQRTREIYKVVKEKLES